MLKAWNASLMGAPPACWHRRVQLLVKSPSGEECLGFEGGQWLDDQPERGSARLLVASRTRVATELRNSEAHWQLEA